MPTTTGFNNRRDVLGTFPAAVSNIAPLYENEINQQIDFIPRKSETLIIIIYCCTSFTYIIFITFPFPSMFGGGTIRLKETSPIK